MPAGGYRAAAWLAASAGVLILGARLLCPADVCTVPGIDGAGLAWLHAARTPVLDLFFAGITWLGSLWLLLPLALVVAWQQSRQWGWRAGLFVPCSLLFASGLSHVAKLLVERPRPDLFPSLIALPADWSFPSAHTMQVTAFALALLLQARVGERLRAALVLACVIGLVGISRIYLQVHFPTDVLFGLVAAIGCVLAARHLMFQPGRLS
jgi:membrane-associated phospholipid phosphatase